MNGEDVRGIFMALLVMSSFWIGYWRGWRSGKKAGRNEYSSL